MAPKGKNLRGKVRGRGPAATTARSSPATNRRQSTQTPDRTDAGGTQPVIHHHEMISRSVQFIRQTRGITTAQACEFLRAMGVNEEQLVQAIMQVRDPLAKSFNCEMKNCSSQFCAKVNLARHMTTHSATSQSKIAWRDEFDLHWQRLSVKDKTSMVSAIEYKLEAIFHQSIDDMLQEVADSPDSKFLPLELVTSTDRLRIIKTARRSESSEFQLLEFLDTCSEGTILCNDIAKIHPPTYSPSQRILETELTEMLAYYSWFLESQLVENLLLFKENLADDLIKKEQERRQKNQRSEQEAKGGNTMHDLPPVDTSIDETAAVSSEAAAESFDAAESSVTAHADLDLKSVYDRFLDVLRKFSFPKSKSSTPYFKGQLEAMYFCGDIHMAIFYWIIKQQDKGLALTIRDYKERVHTSLKSALQQFISEMGYAAKLPIDKIEFEIVDCPPLKRKKSVGFKAL
ncbi:uncharacterized protein [Lolium perenne]|uniref:uncharacterized protein isoform X1 n=1 Tax=Lolium perenne TaxID=4522 RepID=UPI0021F5F615|nr:uncharacterized protein LOC127330065 isoform X1 [Lolium perenne]